jgi:hypothetical protein
MQLCWRSVVSKPSEQPTMTSYIQPQKKYTANNTHQKELKDALVKYIAADWPAIYTVDREPEPCSSPQPKFRHAQQEALSTTLIDS